MDKEKSVSDYMSTSATVPGVIRKSTRVFVTQEDVSELLGCGKSKAYGIVQEVNKQAKRNGNLPFPAGKANKFLFSDVFDIPIEEVDRVINKEQEVHNGIL